MTSAAVGFQCPECVADGRASIPQVRTRLGGAVPRKPYVTYAIIAACVVVFALQYATSQDLTARLELWAPAIALNDEYYRLFSVMFVHAGLLHIGFNMYVLWIIGQQLELILGHVRYATLYVVAGLGGSVASFWFSNPLVPSVGASGAIFGLMGAYVIVGRALRADVTQVLVLIGLNVVLGFVVTGTDWRAHLGGLLTGAVVAAIMTYGPTRAKTPALVLGVLAVVAVLSVLVVLRVHEITRLLQAAGLA
jgi:membrane associated rhomboid family serine protease